MTDHKCNECVRMTVSQDEYISILEEQYEVGHLKTIWNSYIKKEEDWDKERHEWKQERFDFMNKNAELENKNAELQEFAENIVKASADNPNEFFDLKKENEKLKKEIENMRNSVKEVLLSDDCEVGQILNCVGLTWYDKGTVDNIKKENEELKKDNKYLDEKNNEQTVVIIGLVEKLNKISEWVKEQENPDGCIDCDSGATNKLKDILKQN